MSKTVKPYNKTDHSRYLDDGGAIKDPEAIAAAVASKSRRRGPPENMGNYLRDNHRAAFTRDWELRKQNWVKQRSRQARLNDHEIAQLVSAITAEVRPICAFQSLRAHVSKAVTENLGGLK